MQALCLKRLIIQTCSVFLTRSFFMNASLFSEEVTEKRYRIEQELKAKYLSC